MKLVQVIFAITFLLFTVTGFAARQEKTLICHVGNELGPNGEEYDPSCNPEEGFCADAGKIDLIVVAKADKHLNNASHEYDGISDYEPGDAGASGVGTEDSNGDGVDDGCEPAEACPCWDQADLTSVTAENQSEGFSCGPFGALFDFSIVIQNDGTTPGVEGGFVVVVDEEITACITRDFDPGVLEITTEEADACAAQIAARCAAIGPPLPHPP